MATKLEKIEVGQVVSVRIIDKMVNDYNNLQDDEDNEIVRKEYGTPSIGEYFLVLNCRKGRTVSFAVSALDASDDFNFIYKCIYSDFQKPRC